MAIAATTAWEVDANTGITASAMTNGGGFNASRAGAGTDYSLASNSPSGTGGPILALTDLAMVNGGTTLTSSTGGFTAAMIGNLIYIASGTNFVAGWYEITARADTNTVTLDRDATTGGNGSSGVGNVGGCLSNLTDAHLELVVAGNVVYVKGPATYTTGAGINVAADGTAVAPIVIAGYNATRSTVGTCDGSDRPLVACAANTFIVDVSWQLHNLRFTTTDSNGVKFNGTFGLARNCSVAQSSASANRYAIQMSASGVRVIDCELNATAGYGLSLAGTGTHAFACYVHDSANGVLCGSGFGSIVGCVIEACSTAGIVLASVDYMFLLWNTIDTTVDGISATDSIANLVMNNIISNMTSEGAVWTTQTDSNWWDYNDWYGNATDITLIADRHATLTLPGPHDFDADPGYTNAAGGDFSTGANVDNEGFGIRLGVG